MMTSAAPDRVRSPIASDVATTFENVTWSVPSTSIGAAIGRSTPASRWTFMLPGAETRISALLSPSSSAATSFAPKPPPAGLTQVTSGLVSPVVPGMTVRLRRSVPPNTA